MNKLSKYSYLLIAGFAAVLWVASSLDWLTVTASTSAALSRLRAGKAPTTTRLNSTWAAQSGLAIRYTANLIQGSDGYTYGAALTIEDNQNTGATNQWGAIVRFSESGDLNILHSFNRADGAFPAGSLIEANDGFLYGVTSEGGPNDKGTIFRLRPDGREFSTLYHFQGAEDGATPLAGLVEGQGGRLYGTTSQGGERNRGTVYQLSTNNELKVLHTFADGEGADPVGGLLIGVDGYLYGTTRHGGRKDRGTILKLRIDGGDYQTIRELKAKDGTAIDAPLIEGADSWLYGVAGYGGAVNHGTLFRLQKDGNSFEVIHTFDGHDPESAKPRDGIHPLMVILASDGYLYGTTLEGGRSNHGVAYRVRPAGSEYEVMYSFGGAGDDPRAGLIAARDGKVYLPAAQPGAAREIGAVSKAGQAGGQSSVGLAVTQSTLTVNNLNDSGGGSLRDAINNASPGDTINITVNGTITLTTGELAIGKSLTITGPGSGLLTVNGNNRSRVFLIMPGTSSTAGPTVTISGLTIANGLAQGGAGGCGGSGGGGAAGAGGGMFIGKGANVTLKNLAFQNNRAVGGNGGAGYGCGNGGRSGGGGGGGLGMTNGVGNSGASAGGSDGGSGGQGGPLGGQGGGGSECNGGGFGGLGGGGGGGGADNYPSGTFESPCISGFGNSSNFGGGGGGGGGIVGSHGGNSTYGGAGGGGGTVFDNPGTGGFGYGGVGGNGGGCKECGGGGGGGAGLGGALFVWSQFFLPNSQTIVNLVNCSFTGNSVQAGTGGAGGGGAGSGRDGYSLGPDAYFAESETLSECSTINQIFNRCYFEHNFFINHLPEPFGGITGPNQVCANTSYASSFSFFDGNSAGATYVWSIVNGTITGGQGTQTITYTTGTTPGYSFTGVSCTVTGANGCSFSDVRYFDFSPPPAITAPTQVCPNSSGQSASVADAGSGASYSWTIGNGSITGGQGTRQITFSAGASGSTTLNVTVNLNGCSLTGTKSIPLSNGVDPVNVEITYVKAGSCPNSSGNTASVPDSGPNLTYFWTVTGGTITGGQGTREITFTNGIATTVTVSVVITKPSGCGTTISVNIDFTIPVAPVIVCPPEELLYTADQGTNGTVVNYTLPAANNYCGGVSVNCVPPPGSFFPIGNTNGPNFHLGGPTVVTCTSTDSQGTTLHCSFKVGVLSRNAQFTQRPTSITVNADPGACSAAINLRSYFTCTGAPQPVVKFKYGDSAAAQVFETASPVSFPVGTTTIYVFATNGVTLADGRYPATITVNDLTPPAIDCPANITAQSPAGACSAIVNYTVTATDSNCPDVNLVSFPPSGSAFPLGTTIVTSTATDSSGNQSSCLFTVTVTDISPPAITCPANITVPSDPGSCSAVVNFNVLASDQCSPVSIVSSPPSGSTFPLGTTTVTSTATDEAGNIRTCMFNVTVRDTTPPDITCPGDITRSADSGSCSALVSYTVTSSDNCANPSVVCSPSSGAIFAKGTTSVSCTATDGSGNTKSCSFTVTVTDTEAPKSCVTPPPGMVSWWSGDGNANDLQGGNNGILQNSAAATAAGKVGQAFSFNGLNDYVTVANHATLNGFSSATIDAWIKLNTVSGRQGIVSKVPVGEYYLLINNGRLSFENTNIASGAFTGATQLSPNVWYHVAVSYDGASTTLYVNGIQDGVLAGAWSNANSQPLSIGQRGDNSDFFNGFIDEVEIFNRALLIAEIQNIYSAGGFGKCKPVVANAAAGQCSAVVNYTAPSFSDNCTTASMNCSPASGTTFLKGVTSVSCTALDAAGNSFANAFVVKVNDMEAPVIPCPSPVDVHTDSGQCTAVVNYTPPTATDNCTTVHTVCAPAPGYAFPKGVTDVTCTATDGMGNTTSCTFTVTVNDVTPPALTCPLPIIQSTDSGLCTAVITFITPVASDNCPGAAVVCSPASGATFNKGITTVTCTATDTANNTAQCTFTVTVNDTTPPAIPSPANITQPAATGQCSLAVTYTTPAATDDCSGVGAVTCTPASGATFQKGTTTVTCSASDAGGNANSCSFTVTINDTQPPTITCPPPVTHGTDANLCMAVVTYSTPAATDNCPGVGTPVCSPASGSTFQKGVTTVSCSVSDAANYSATCTFTVTVNDTQAPTIACPAPITHGTDPNVCTAVVTFAPTVTDNCSLGANPIVCSPASGSTFNKGVTTVSCTATDTSNNTSNCTFTVTVNDTQAPSITCPSPITQPATAGQCSKVVTYSNATATDNCPNVGTPSCVPASGATFQKGVTTVTCTVTDASNNPASCTFTVTITDTQPPGITCPANVTKGTDPNVCQAVVTYPNATATDNCSGVGTPSCVPAPGSTFQKGVTTVTCTVSDSSNNSANCSFTVTVNDTQAPNITCPANISQAAAGSQCSAVVTYSNATAADNCPNVGTPSCAPASGSTFQKGTTTVTCTVSDASNNPASGTFTVTVNDTQAPTITCPANVTRGTDPNQCSAVVTYPNATASDNCQGVGAPTCTPVSGSPFLKGVTTVTCTVSDASNNTVHCSFTVTVNDMQPPNITAPANATHGTDPNQCQAVMSYPGPMVSDNCPGVGAPTCSPAAGSTFPKGATTITCTVKDSSNNVSMCSFLMTVVDTQPPVFPNECPAGITKSAQATCPFTTSLMVNYTRPIATDNCGPSPTVVCNPPSGSTFPLGTTAVTCIATDSSGNTATCSFPINVFSFCMKDDSIDFNAVFVNAVTGDYLFCQNGVTLASGKGTLVAHGCTFQIDHTKGDRKVLIQGDTSANSGGGSGTAYIQKLGGGVVVQITDRNMSNNACTCAPGAPPPEPNK